MTKLLIVLMLLCTSAYAQFDCEQKDNNRVNRPVWALSDAYQICRESNALERIATALEKPKAGSSEGGK